MQLNNRQREIVSRLIQREPIQLRSLIEEYPVSKRTIYNDINTIKEWANQLGVFLNNSSASLLAVTAAEDIQLLKLKLQEITPFSTPLNQLSRSNLLLSSILLAEKTLTVPELCKQIGVSRTTFYRDLEYVKLWLEKFNITLDISKSIGVELQCVESGYREALVYFIKKNFDHYDLLGMLNGKNTEVVLKNEKIIIYQQLTKYFQNINITLMLDILEKIQVYTGKQFYDKDSHFMIWIMIVSISRIYHGYPINDNYRFNSVIGSNEQRMLETYLNDYASLNLSEKEICYLTLHLKAVIHQNDHRTFVGDTMDHQLMKLVENISYRTAVPMLTDLKLIENLKIHIVNALNRKQLDITELNPLKDEILARYPELFAICKEEIERLALFDEVISDDELSYIVIYIAAAIERIEQANKRVYAVCTTGKASAELLLVNLKRRFPDLNVLGTIPMSKAKVLDDEYVDAIISTTQFTNLLIPVITVNPLLTKEDAAKISRILMVNINELPMVEYQNESKRSDGFMDTMYLMSDCATALDELLQAFGYTVSNSIYIGILIHLMMQLNQSRNEKKIDINSLKKEDLTIYQILSGLYKKYGKILSDYDIKSIQTYLKGR